MRGLSLFTGGGIGDLAAAAAGLETVAQCENDPVCQYALRQLWPDSYLFEDVHDVSGRALRQRGLWPIDIISGGFPCQDISTAWRGAGIEGSRSGLWREMFRVIRQVRPAWILIENVPALRVRGADRVIAPLERIGYTCWPLVVGAWAVGAPQKRDRVWIVGYAGSVSVDGRTPQPWREEVERIAPLWPSLRGRRQSGWERSRLFEFGVGGATDGVAGRVHSRANKAMLRILGNGWVYPIAEIIYRWIASKV